MKITANNPEDQLLAEAFNAVLERQKDAPLFLHPEMGRAFEEMGLLKPGDWAILTLDDLDVLIQALDRFGGKGCDLAEDLRKLREATRSTS